MKSAALIVLAVALGGCTGWVPVRTARDIGIGQRVKVERASGSVELDKIVVCDHTDFVFAKQWGDCRTALTFDIRHEKVFAQENHGAVIAAFVILGIAAPLFIVVIFLGGAALGRNGV